MENLLDFDINYNLILLGMSILAIIASLSLWITMLKAPQNYYLITKIKKEFYMLNVYLSGEIHSNWREEIINYVKDEKLEISFSSPVTDHEASDNCGIEILGSEENNFWKDNKGAKINSIKTKNSNNRL